MCVNYIPVTDAERLREHYAVERDRSSPTAEIWALHRAPFIKLVEPGSAIREVQDGIFGFMASWATEIKHGRNMQNARSETVATKPSFKESWARGRRCIVPAEAFFENCHENNQIVRWRIQRPDGQPMGIAGVYRLWRDREGEPHYSFAMLTCNCDSHPVTSKFHAEGEEKRMPIILDPADYDDWLTCPVAEASKYFKAWLGPLEAFAAPQPPRAPRTYSGKVVAPPPKPDKPQGGLF